MGTNINKIDAETRVKEFEKWLKQIPTKLWNDLWFIPIVPNSKIPDVPKGESWLDEKYRLSIDDVVNRLKAGKNAAFVATPNTLVVVDLDLYDATEDVREEFLRTFPPTLHVYTPHGGIHKYYIPVNEIRNADGKGRFKGCGEVRANRKYVLVPGSVVDGRMYTVEEHPVIGLSNAQIPEEFKPNVDEIEIEKDLERTQFEQFKNRYGWSLSDIVMHDLKLWVLLSFLHPAGYPSISEADMATMTKLRFWEFDEQTIYDIIRTFRKREKVLKRDDYLIRTYKKAVPSQLISDFVNPKTWNPKFNTIEQGIIENATKLADPPFNIEIFPGTSFIRKYVETMMEFTDAYPEYHLCCAFSLLSTAVDKNIEIMVKPRVKYTNTWFLMIGDSTISRKTTSLDLMRDVLSFAGLDNKLIAEEFSIEAFIDELESKPHALFMKDEIGNFVSTFKKVYGLGVDTLFCTLYNSPSSYTRKLRKRTITIQDPYLNIIATGTLRSIVGYLSEKDIDTGFLPRFLIVMPERYKPRKRIDKLDPQLENKKIELAGWLRELHETITKLVEWNNAKLPANFSDEALDRFNSYTEEKEKEIFDMHDVDRSRWSAIFGRLSENILKIAVLIKLSYRETIDELKMKPFDLTISESEVEKAIKIVDELFGTYAYRFMISVECNTETNVVEKLASIIQKEGEIDRSTALKRSKLKKKDFEEALETLKLRRDIIVREVESGGRRRTVIYWIGR